MTRERNRIFGNSIAAVQNRSSRLSLSEEIDTYFETASTFPHNKTTLDFWKVNKEKLPILTQLARIVLGLPATSASAESKFSISGSLLAANRSTLHPEKAKRILYVHDNYDLIKNDII